MGSRGKTGAPSHQVKRLVWRMSANAPKGEWVPAGAPTKFTPLVDLTEVSYGSWVTSSHDLLDGVRVVEGTDTVPDPLLDDLLTPPGDAPKSSGP